MSNFPGPRNFSLRNVNSSKPQVYRTDSAQSVAASDDYYSFSDRVTASPDSQVTAMHYATPNSRPSSRASEAEHATMNEHYQAQFAQNQDSPRPPTESTVRFGEDRIARISPRSDETVRRVPRSDEYAGPAPTPGLDDTPYVQFALNQLTRDEEVNGVGRQDSVSTNRDEYPADRLVWDESLGYFTRTRTPIRYTETPQRPKYKSPSPQALPQRPDSIDPESFVAVDPPEKSLMYPALDYLPVVLRSWALLLAILSCCLMIAGLAFCNVWSHRHKGIWDYDGKGGSRYFVMQFLPQILAALIILWSFVIQAAVYRIAPFAIMAAGRKKGNVLQGLPILPRNFVLPDFSHFRYGEPLFGFALFAIWLSNFFSIPLISCLFQAKYYNIDGQGIWRWTSVQSVGWTLIASYGLLTIGLLLILLRFVRGWTGLMWDPVCLADLVSIIQRSNILHDYEHSETVPSVRETLDSRVLRLGYWKLSMKPEIFYGVGEVDAPIRTPSLHQTEKSRDRQPQGMTKVRFDLENNGNSGDHHLYSPAARYRWTPWFLRQGSVITWITIVFALFIAFVAVSFVNNAIKGGFPPKLPTLPSISAFSSSNFLYSFIPGLIGNFLFLALQPIDLYFRALQPFVDLSAPNGASADKSILLAYPSALPIQVTMQAIINGHWRVAWLSFISLVSIAIPILAGGIFIALWYPSDNDVRISAVMPAYYTLIAFCALYAVSFVVVWPGRRRYLPHDISTLSDLMSFLYQSPLLADKLLREPRSKTDLVTRLIVAPPSERLRPMYGFGIYVGRDGKEHLGIDRFTRPGRTDMLITTGSMK
ncbi:hypothetical protein N7520_002794 [Penicillium odoratum]|uniref:uncharacterized protein n=1 Tax=Penicillium odoratum TaxID=1167516 RepID=UPI00254917C0|nr:uncharacterized protein N7520_002794 [Penicillium odoratum]KAJ5772265.1 hypothetical protein N7520_002794 [Penicillium odoratum]